MLPFIDQLLCIRLIKTIHITSGVNMAFTEETEGYRANWPKITGIFTLASSLLLFIDQYFQFRIEPYC